MMPEAKYPEDEGDQRDEDISRWAILGGEIVTALLLPVVLYFTFELLLGPKKATSTSDLWIWILGWWSGSVTVFLFFWLLRRYNGRWLRLAQRPARELAGGDATAAERSYEKVLAYVKRFPANDHRRGTMLLELGNFLVSRGRRRDAREILDESVAILKKNSAKNPLNYLTALNSLAVFLMTNREYQAAQQTLERVLDLTPVIKKTNIQYPEFDMLLHLNLAVLFIRTNRLDKARSYLDVAEKTLGALGQRRRNAFRNTVLGHRALWNCAVGHYEAADNVMAQVTGARDSNLLSVQAKIHLARREFVEAERILGNTIGQWANLGTSHRPENIDNCLDLAEALFGQLKHDAAFASLQEARSIVADFAMPADAAWCKTLETWLQRAREPGKADEVASLEAELQKIPVTANHVITILEKFRIHPQAAR